MQSTANLQNNKRIAKNTLYLYLRKIINLFLAFYGARLLLKALGVEDYGLYGLVGSVVAIFASLRVLFSSSIQRYINIAKGAGEFEKVQMIFSIGVKIHLWISIGFLILAEITGFIVIPHLNIAASNMMAAHWIWQFSIFTSIAGIMTVPYDALIISNERFDAYAAISMIESFLKFAVVLLLFLDDGSRVILYAGLICGVSVFIRFLNFFYCKKQFGNEAIYRSNTDRALLKKMTAFAGWQFMGNASYAAQNSGLSIVLNIFGGTIANAARSIAYQVLTTVVQFTSDINVSFQPRVMMEFSQGNVARFYQLLFMSAKTALLISSVIAFPIIIFTPSILSFWLTETPEHTVPFVRWIMIYAVLRSLHSMFDLFFKTHGILRNYQICEFVSLLISIPIAWAFLQLGYPLWTVFMVMGLIELINLFLIAGIATKQLNFKLGLYLKSIVGRFLIAAIILAGIGLFILNFVSINNSVFTTIGLCVGGALLTLLVDLGTLFSKSEIRSMIHIIKR